MAYLIMAVVFLLCSGGAEGSSSCCHQQNSNGTFSFFVSVNKTCEDYSWKDKDTAVAHGRGFNETLVQDYGPTYIVFESCRTNVTYFCDRETTITCESICPTQSRQEVNHKHTITTPRNIREGGENHVRNHSVVGGIVAGVVIAVVAVAGIIAWKKCKKSDPV